MKSDWIKNFGKKGTISLWGNEKKLFMAETESVIQSLIAWLCKHVKNKHKLKEDLFTPYVKRLNFFSQYAC